MIRAHVVRVCSRPGAPLVLQMKEPIGDCRSSASSITAGDIVAAYANGGSRDRRGNYEKARIAAWPDVHDTKAVCVTARR